MLFNCTLSKPSLLLVTHTTGAPRAVRPITLRKTGQVLVCIYGQFYDAEALLRELLRSETLSIEEHNLPDPMPNPCHATMPLMTPEEESAFLDLAVGCKVSAVVERMGSADIVNALMANLVEAGLVMQSPGSIRPIVDRVKSEYASGTESVLQLYPELEFDFGLVTRASSDDLAAARQVATNRMMRKEQNLQKPTRTTRSWPFKTMQIGDKVLYPIDDAASARNAISSVSRRHNFKFVTHSRVRDGTIEIIRVS